MTTTRVHNHLPYRPICPERTLPDDVTEALGMEAGQRRGDCLEDDGCARGTHALFVEAAEIVAMIPEVGR